MNFPVVFIQKQTTVGINRSVEVIHTVKGFSRRRLRGGSNICVTACEHVDVSDHLLHSEGL